jgi:hypothetical protein
VVELKQLAATGNSQISFTDQVLNMKEFTSLIQSEATGPSNTTQQTGTQSAERRHYILLTFWDKGTEIPSLSWDKGTARQAQNLATGRDGTGF